MAVSVATFEQVALEDTDEQWEWQCGKLRRKPGMTQEHNSAGRRLASVLSAQLSLDDYEVSLNAGHTRRPDSSYFIPDVMVVPGRLIDAQSGTMKLEAYTEPAGAVLANREPLESD